MRTVWSPAKLPGIALWLRADDLAALADAAAVSSWISRIGGYNFAQATGTKQPLFYKSTGARLINGKPVVTSDGVDDLLVYAGTISSALSGHVIAVARIVSVPGAFADEVVMASSDEALNTKFVRFSIGAGSNPLVNMDLRFTQRNADTTDIVDVADTIIAAGSTYAIEFASSGTAYSGKVNGVNQASVVVTGGANNGDWFGDTADRDNVTLFAWKRSGSEILFSNLDLAEIIRVDDQTISMRDRQCLNTYNADRYALIAA